ncbi:hypothetical protein NONO_c24650 [Nocardia nova SH22a]|uniref:Uncharacterized protein n=1 Tax=Nocardia nova SH22a TaxID=1415166 RepID=W5TJ27_9NOCA|nr:hypothetical protein [Nocardia nova]AHH17261.1 hypothetical protein NONO_c24650 [Nocardia nova SH22a]
MYLREKFGFPPPPVRMEVGYDPKQDAVFLKIGRKGVQLVGGEVEWLIHDLRAAVVEQIAAGGVEGF